MYPTHFWWTYGAEILHGSRYQPRESSGYPGWRVGSIFGGGGPQGDPGHPREADSGLYRTVRGLRRAWLWMTFEWFQAPGTDPGPLRHVVKYPRLSLTHPGSHPAPGALALAALGF